MAAKPPVNKPLGNALGRLSRAAESLNERTDAANRLIAETNHTLGKQTVGVELWLKSGPWPVILGGTELSVGVVGSQLGFAKVGNDWALALRTVVADQKYYEGDE